MMNAVGLDPERHGRAGRQGNRAEGQPLHRRAEAPFDTRMRGALTKQGFAVRYVELWSDPRGAQDRRPRARRNTPVPACGLNAWGKPEINLVCGDCEEPMEAGAGEDDT